MGKFYFTGLVMIFLISKPLFSQYYETGQDPAALKWLSIKTDRFIVIYPEQYGENGKEFARSLEEASSKLHLLFPEMKFRIPVIIHNYTTLSNGYVAWAPKRMEIYPTPEQNTIPLDPVKQLSYHETAHVLQMVSLNKGFTRVLSALGGEQVFGAEALMIPLWFMEGDAVFAETALTNAGRGRSPAFMKEFRAITVDNAKPFRYDQIVCGSYRNYIPDHYRSGYQMVAWTMAPGNSQAWNKMLDFTAKYPFSINPVNLSLKQSIGLTKKKLYLETFDRLKTIWQNDITESGAVTYNGLNPAKKNRYINYYSPVSVGKDSVIAVKTTLSGSPEFVLVNTQTRIEKRLFFPGQIYPYRISCGNKILVWVETRNDPRWANRQYSVIRTLDLRNGSPGRIEGKSRYMSVAISADGRTIAATENSVRNINKLVLIDVVSREILTSVPSPGNAYLQRPEWSADGKNITFISLTGKGEGVISYNLSEKLWISLIPEGNNDLQSSALRNDSLFFVSSVSGTDNIYVLSPDKKLSNLTNTRFGTSDLCLNGGEILFSDYSTSGNNLSVTRITDKVSPADSTTGASSFLINRFKAEPLPAQEKSLSSYTPVPYRKWQHIFKFHSWMPFYADLETIKSDPASARPGLTLMSQNNLSTLITSLGYEYSQDRRNLLHSRITWQGWYPVLETSIDYGYNPSVAKFGENVDGPQTINPGFRFTNTVSVPLSFSTGRFYQYLRPSLTSEYANNYIYLKESQSYDYGQNLISARIFFSNYSSYAYRDIYPRWGQTIDINYTYAPLDKAIYGNEVSLRTAIYIPGFLPNNGIRLRYEKEIQSPKKFLLGSRISLPRGYINIISRDLNLFSADYVLPLVYPDINIGSLLYIKRIRTALFYDYAEGTGNTYYEQKPEGLKATAFHDYSETFSSRGFELMADFHIFRIPYAISGGVQSSWITGSNTPVLRMLLNIDLFGMAIGKKSMLNPGM
jgi:hypothetical protein